MIAAFWVIEFTIVSSTIVPMHDRRRQSRKKLLSPVHAPVGDVFRNIVIRKSRFRR